MLVLSDQQPPQLAVDLCKTQIQSRFGIYHILSYHEADGLIAQNGGQVLPTPTDSNSDWLAIYGLRMRCFNIHSRQNLAPH